MLTSDDGFLRKGSKACLVHKLAVWETKKTITPDIIIVDGNPLLYRVRWSSDIKNLARNFCSILPKEAVLHVIVFDKYIPNSIKSQERRRRGEFIDTSIILEDWGNIPDRETVMKNIAIKSQLIHKLSEELEKLRIIIDRGGWQEEADCNIIRYLYLNTQQQHRHIQIMADDTDIFILLLYHVGKWTTTPLITMRKRNGRVIDINASIKRLGPSLCNHILGIHAITGCDTTSFLPGLGKNRILSKLNNHHLHMDEFGNSQLEMERILTIGRKIFRILKLPQKNIDEHIKRSHLQTYLWKRAIDNEPPLNMLDKTHFGWTLTGDPIIE